MRMSNSLAVSVLLALGCCSEPAPNLKIIGFVRLGDFDEVHRSEAGVVPVEVQAILDRFPDLHAFSYSLTKDGGGGKGVLVLTAGGEVIMMTGDAPTYATEGKGAESVRLYGYQSLTRSKADRGRVCDGFLTKMIEDAGKEGLLREVNEELTRHERPSVFHYVRPDKTGGWQFGVLAVEVDGSLILRRKLGVEY